jgi:hypothetical protein
MPCGEKILTRSWGKVIRDKEGVYHSKDTWRWRALPRYERNGGGYYLSEALVWRPQAQGILMMDIRMVRLNGDQSSGVGIIERSSGPVEAAFRKKRKILPQQRRLLYILPWLGFLFFPVAVYLLPIRQFLDYNLFKAKRTLSPEELPNDTDEDKYVKSYRLLSVTR